MAAPQRILVSLVDLGEPSPAAARGQSLANALGAEFRLVSCTRDARGSDDQSDGIVAAARDFAADLLVTGYLQSGQGRPAALTRTDWQVIRHSPCPVLFARHAGKAAYREILVAVDPMHAHDRPAALDDALITLAASIAGACGARLRLLHCHLPAEYVPLRAPGAVSAAAIHRGPGSVEGHRDALLELARRHGLAPDAAVLEPADPRDGIPDVAARLGTDLVVMGAVTRSRLRRLLIGSTTEPVLDSLACDFLVLKPPSAAT
jgi:universal stress protein E